MQSHGQCDMLNFNSASVVPHVCLNLKPLSYPSPQVELPFETETTQGMNSGWQKKLQ